jgi:sarcosine oxidase subunit alpha
VSAQPFRLPEGGCIDRTRRLAFRFEGRPYEGYAGDTLASALLANGVRVAARSFKYHRPRGLMGAGIEEPNVLVTLAAGNPAPNLRATEIALFDGLDARAVNCWPGARFDVGAAANALSAFLPAGFYYKTFMWPSWKTYEWFIRRAAGLGRLRPEPDNERHERRHAHCDVLVVGAGPAGLAAARAAAATEARVILCEQDDDLGGSLLWDAAPIGGTASGAWIGEVEHGLEARPEATILRNTTALGYFDHNAVIMVEKPSGDGPLGECMFRHRLWQVRAKRVILATGAIERPLVFPGNDRPGVMLCTAVHRFLVRHAVAAGRNIAIFTNNDAAYGTAHALLDRGIAVAAFIDSRAAPAAANVQGLRGRGVEVIAGGRVIATAGARALRSITVMTEDRRARALACDVLGMSGGFNPNVQLFAQSGGKLAYDAELASFKPARSVQAEQSAGAASGVFGLNEALRQGHEAGIAAARAAGFAAADPGCPAAGGGGAFGIEPCWEVAGRGKSFVDFQNDVTTEDIALAARENFTSVEHLKRYTTLGMGTDQGKTANVNALAIMGALTGRTPAETGTTTFRFPFVPVPFGALAGRARGELLRPMRRMPAHAWHAAHDAVFEEFGGWMRPACYPRPGEGREAAVRREARAVRMHAGIFDASPLGKIEVKGRDAATFLDFIYCNAMSSLKPGQARYGMMLDEQGAIFDDGVAVRISQDHFLLSTTSGGAVHVANWLEEWLQCQWTEWEVIVAPVTTAWGTVTLSGPRARDILAAAGTDIPLGDFPHMAWRAGTVAGMPARIARVSFTGEMSYEISVAAGGTAALWERCVAAGAPHGLEPIGIDALMLLRTEKGYLHVGTDTDGTTTPADIGWGHVLRRGGDFAGRRSLTRPAMARDDRYQFVGLAAEGSIVLPVGAHVVTRGDHMASEGYVTSSGFSPALNRGVALGMVRRGQARPGEAVTLVTRGKRMRARIVAPCAYDPDGTRLDA